jgi:hypothetical protein
MLCARGPRSRQAEQAPSRGAAAAAGPKQTGSACSAAEAPAASSQPRRGRQPTGRSGRSFRTLLQLAGARKDLRVGLGRGDEQGGWGAARAERWRLREARRALRVAGCLPVLCPGAQPLRQYMLAGRCVPRDYFGQV